MMTMRDEVKSSSEEMWLLQTMVPAAAAQSSAAAVLFGSALSESKESHRPKAMARQAGESQPLVRFDGGSCVCATGKLAVEQHPTNPCWYHRKGVRPVLRNILQFCRGGGIYLPHAEPGHPQASADGRERQFLHFAEANHECFLLIQ